MINARQNHLHRTALGADHQIDTLRITPHALVKLRGGEQQQHNRCHAECKQQNIQQRVKAARFKIGEADSGEVHFATPNS